MIAATLRQMAAPLANVKSEIHMVSLPSLFFASLSSDVLLPTRTPADRFRRGVGMGTPKLSGPSSTLPPATANN